MKIIPFHKNDTALIKKAAQQDREAQHQLYHNYASKMLSVCRRYIKDIHFAEEVMLNGFLKVFVNLKKFAFEGNFEGWIRRIMINECISHLRKQKKLFFTEDIMITSEASWNNISMVIDVDQIQEVIDRLPEGYKTVFVLYAIEGYKHLEIAKMLDISESTSKSQLFKARKLLQQKIKELNTTNHGAIKI